MNRAGVGAPAQLGGAWGPTLQCVATGSWQGVGQGHRQLVQGVEGQLPTAEHTPGEAGGSHTPRSVHGSGQPVCCGLRQESRFSPLCALLGGRGDVLPNTAHRVGVGQAVSCKLKWGGGCSLPLHALLGDRGILWPPDWCVGQGLRGAHFRLVLSALLPSPRASAAQRVRLVLQGTP